MGGIIGEVYDHQVTGASSFDTTDPEAEFEVVIRVKSRKAQLALPIDSEVKIEVID